MIAKDCLRCKVIISTWSRWSSRWSLKKLKKGIPVGTWTRNFCILSNYGHTQLNPPHPVRSAQLNSWWQSQYYGGGPHGNTLCCNFLFLFLFLLFSLLLLTCLASPGSSWWGLSGTMGSGMCGLTGSESVTPRHLDCISFFWLTGSSDIVYIYILINLLLYL